MASTTHTSATSSEKVSKRQWITKHELVELSKIKPSRIIADLGLNWLLIVATIQIALLAGNTFPLWAAVIVYALAFIGIACLQNALTLWAHEASHYNLSRDKKRNDIIGDLFVAGPIGMTVGQYRWHHVPHHLYLNDPEREVNPLAWICIRGTHLFKEIILSMLGKYGVQAITRYGSDDPKYEKRPSRTPASLVSFLISNGLLFALCALQGQWYAFFILWIAPIFTLTLMIGNFRTIVEHQSSSDVCDTGLVPLPAITRVIQSHPLERLLIAPVGLYFHHEHHMYPGVPYHRLRDVRKLLTERGYFSSSEIVYGDGYVRTLWRIAMQPGYGIRLLNPFMVVEDDHGHAPEAAATLPY
ncbi:MAG: fatty acid desaturase family protein [bacterium]|nr:fatty acid desaturase family protein [bacterium]